MSGSANPPQVRHARGSALRWSRPGRTALVVALWAIVVGGLLLAWLFRDSISEYGPATVDPTRVMLPVGAPGSPLGTDALGRDILARLLAGIPVSMVAGVAPATAAMAIGILLGLLAGALGGWIDRSLVAGADILMGFPFILLAILFVAILGPSLLNAMIAVALATVPRNIRLIRAEALSLRERDYVVAARLAGGGHATVIGRHLFPNVLPVALIVGSTEVGAMIGATAGLSFLGLGVQPPGVDWGTMIADGAKYITVAPVVAIVPSVMVALLSLVFVMLGDELRRRISTSDR
ncbi:MAG: ABC transporter permease [Chloroflexi bacterium]|nr:ABC transporter permease [Chloroflexota bacterium]